MTGELIKSFLVGLGFEVDSSSLAQFNKAIASAALRVTALYTSIQVAAAGIFYSISKISDGFEQMGYEYRLIAPAISKTLLLRRALLQAYAAAGINVVKVVKESVKFNFSLAKTKFALEAIYKSVGVKFIPLLTKQMDIFRSKIYANMPKIQAALTRFVNLIFAAFNATIILGVRVWAILGRIYDFFVSLDQKTDGWSTRIIALIAAWKLLNLAFLATPIGLMLTGLVALLGLFDDLKGWGEGKESLIPWGDETVRTITGITAVVGSMAAVIYTIIQASKLWAAAQWLVNVAMTANPLGIIIASVTALIALLSVLVLKLKALSGVKSFFEGIGGNIVDAIAGKTPTNTNPLNAPNKSPINNFNTSQASPLVSPNTGVNQNIRQKTDIIVQGAGDANAVGQKVVSEQGKVNFDLTRNLKSAAQ